MMISRTAVKYDKLPRVFIIIVKISFRDFQDFASLKTRRRRKERSMDKLLTFSKSNSINDRTTITKSKIFQLSYNIER